MFGNFATSNGGDGTEVLMIYGKQDRHVDGDGRLRTYKLMTDAGVHFEWLEVKYTHHNHHVLKYDERIHFRFATLCLTTQ